MSFQKEIFNPDISQTHGTQAFINNLIERIKKEISVCLPAQVKAYDRAAHKVSIHLGLRNKTKAGTIYEVPVIENVPVVINGGGGYCVNFPLNAGDKGWLLIADKDISGFVNSLAISTPNTFRLHNLADAVFIPDVMKTAQINEADAGRAVFQTLDGSVKVSLGQDNIKVLGDVSHNGNLDIDGNINITGNLVVAGDISSSGAMEAGNGATGTFTDTGAGATGMTLTINKGIITQIS
jgi:hypothetical protein